DLSRAGIRLKGFCRTNLFKRLESCGYGFLLSVERHILRNYIFLHAIENDLPMPIGTQDMGLLDSRVNDSDSDLFDGDDDDNGDNEIVTSGLRTEADFKKRAAEVYETYAKQFRRRFKWLRSDLFDEVLAQDLRRDAQSLITVLKTCGGWDSKKDAKLKALTDLLTKTHPKEKVIIFTQFADTVDYLETRLKAAGIKAMAGVTGDSANPTEIAWRFSPVSNNKRDLVKPDQELRVVIATDVLSEGQNLQDCCVIVNFDLPWAIIRLIQRAGRVDRIGQKSDQILCYSFLPADGVERIIRLRARVRTRLRENAEVVGTDEAFFDDDRDDMPLFNLYHEKAGILDGDDDTEVDLASYAYQIWKNATDANPELAKIIPAMPNVVYSTRPHRPTADQPEGALVYLRTAEGSDALTWVNREGKSVTESQFTILKAAECAPDTPAVERHPDHHEMVRKAVEMIVEEGKSVGGQLGRPSGARFRAYERLKNYIDPLRGTLFETQDLLKAVDDIYKFPLLQSATDTLNRQLKSGISDPDLAQLVVGLRSDNRLCRVSEEQEAAEPQIICSLGLRAGSGTQ
ncbi:MAG TPA: C-terminal helicase domain-containing protein, partial [Phycisphaerae bacterium]|nr:C-terminal helicase domain-containing protein [Phycisphaerae bacterium]